MSPRPSWRLGARALVLQAALLQAALLVAPAHAQHHADAGAGRRAAAPAEPTPAEPAPAEPAPAEPAEHAPLNGVSTLKRLPKSAQLSEKVRARLERRAARHAANLPPEDLAETAAQAAPSQLGPAVAAGQVAPSDEPLRRGEARQRRVQALDTGEGLTVLSNRLVLPEPSLALTARRSIDAVPIPEPEPEPPVEAPDEPTLAEAPSITETHSLRTLAQRPSKARPAPAGLGWLVWPFALVLLGGAVVGTLWFRKKTE